MSLSSNFKSFILIALAFNLGACSYLLPTTTPNLGGLLVDRGDTRPFEKPLPINTQPKRLALGHSFAVGIKEDGTVWSWGYGMLGLGKFENRPHPQAIPNMTDFVEVALSSEHVLALRKDGTVWAWGNNEKGQLGYKVEGLPYGEPPNIRFSKNQLTPKQIPDLKDIVSISAGGDESYALDKQGNVYQWGLKELSRDRKHDVLIRAPQHIYHHADAVRVFSNGALMVLTRDGKVKVLTSRPDVWLPIAIKMTETAEAVLPNQTVYELKLPRPVVDTGSARWCSYFLLNDGSVWAIGDNKDGGLGQGDLSQYQGLVKVKNIGRITQLAGNEAAAIDEKNNLWLWGSNIYWRPALDAANNNKESYPIRVSMPAPIKFITGSMAIAIGLEDGRVLFMQEDLAGIRGTGKPSRSPQTTELLMTREKSLWTWK
ncbi:MAG: hypothetical protein Q7U16_08350 [Agitococcus sp.]|nr:hypothetical protein [Agitococcus sp.]